MLSCIRFAVVIASYHRNRTMTKTTYLKHYKIITFIIRHSCVVLKYGSHRLQQFQVTVAKEYVPGHTVLSLIYFKRANPVGKKKS